MPPAEVKCILIAFRIPGGRVRGRVTYVCPACLQTSSSSAFQVASANLAQVNPLLFPFGGDVGVVRSGAPVEEEVPVVSFGRPSRGVEARGAEGTAEARSSQGAPTAELQLRS